MRFQSALGFTDVGKCLSGRQSGLRGLHGSVGNSRDDGVGAAEFDGEDDDDEQVGLFF